MRGATAAAWAWGATWAVAMTALGFSLPAVLAGGIGGPLIGWLFGRAFGRPFDRRDR